MNIQKLLTLTESLYKGQSLTLDKLQKLEAVIKNYNIPSDYLEFMSLFDGAEGELTEDRYLSIWNIDDIISVNEQYIDDPVFGIYFIFGSSGGTFHYAFNKSTGNIYELDLYEDSYSKLLSSNLTDFIESFPTFSDLDSL